MVSTLSLTIEKHFCGDTLVDVAIFLESDKCGMDMASAEKETQLDVKSCCKDVVDVIEGQDDLTVKSFDDLEDIQQQVLFTFVHTYFELFEDASNLGISSDTYHPPKLIQDIHVLYETYLI